MAQPLSAESRPTPTIEDYLAIMYVIDRDGEEIIAARLAESMDVTPPTVTVTLKRMERDGWIEVERRKNIHLTELGYEAASSVIRRHMLTEWMLARMLKVPWSDVHSEAHAIEHSISDDIENKMRQNFDDPQVCPHGNPLPGYEYVTAQWKPLIKMQASEQVVIRRIHEIAEGDSELMQFLESNGVIPGTQAEICEVLPFNQTLTLDLGDRRVVLGFPAAQYIYVEKV
jgi:DtxR family transcriptional regulator, Mn-dependent transcriptional regulator